MSPLDYTHDEIKSVVEREPMKPWELWESLHCASGLSCFECSREDIDGEDRIDYQVCAREVGDDDTEDIVNRVDIDSIWLSTGQLMTGELSDSVIRDLARKWFRQFAGE